MLACPPEYMADYGIYPPRAVRRLVIAGAVASLTGSLILLFGENLPGWWKMLAITGTASGLLLIIMSLVMVWISKVWNLKWRDKIVMELNLQGHEQVLDVGCGRGLLLLGLAKKLSSGRAVGIDQWNVHDASGNAITATEENARRENVTEKVELHAGDMRQLPFAHERFDVVVSSWAIRNITHREGRRHVINEIHRVLKPNGRLVILDVYDVKEYQQELMRLGWKDLERRGPTFRFFVPAYQLWGRKSVPPVNY